MTDINLRFPGRACYSQTVAVPKDVDQEEEEFFAFGRAANNVNMFCPSEMTWTAGSGWGNGLYNQVATFNRPTPANYVNQWTPGEGPYPYGFQTQWASPTPSVIFSGAYPSPDGTNGATKMVESAQTTGDVGLKAVKPAPWTIVPASVTGWSQFWTDAVAVVPCWEGTGNPTYYGAGAVSQGTLTPVNSPAWGTTVAGTSLSLSGGATGTAPDWQIPASGGNDIVPTTKYTILMVKKPKNAQVNRTHTFGLLTTGSSKVYAGIPTSYDSVGMHIVEFVNPGGGLGWGQISFGTSPDRYTGYEPSTDIEIWAFVNGNPNNLGPNPGKTIYFNGVEVKHDANSNNHTKGNFAFGLNTGYDVTSANGSDILFFAILDAEWTDAQVATWAADPYGPIRSGGSLSYNDGGGGIQRPLQHYCGSGVFIPGTWLAYGVWQFRTQVIAKAAERTRISLSATGFNQTSTFSGVRAVFDLTGGQVAIPAAAHGSSGFVVDGTGIENMGSGWFRCWMDFTSPNTNEDSTVRCFLTIDKGSGTQVEHVDYVGDGTSGVYVWKSNCLPPRFYSEITDVLLYDDFTSLANHDVNDTRATGYTWYVHNYWPAFSGEDFNEPTPPGRITIEDGTVLKFSFDGAHATQPNQIASAVYLGPESNADPVPFSGGPGYSPTLLEGKSFTTPFYWQMRSRWDNSAQDIFSAHGPPAFWGSGLEGMLDAGPGGPPFNLNFPPAIPMIELGVIEADRMIGGTTIAGAGFWEWSSDIVPGNPTWGSCRPFFNLTQATANDFHEWTLVVLPVTAGETGQVLRFFDGAFAFGNRYGAAVDAGGGVGVGALIDFQHFPVILNGLGFRVDWVRLMGSPGSVTTY